MIQSWLQKLLFLIFIGALCFSLAGFRDAYETQSENSVYFGQGLSILEQERNRLVYKELLEAQNMTFSGGDFMAQKLREANISEEIQKIIIEKLDPVFPLNRIRPGQNFTLLWSSSEPRNLVAINIPINSKTYLLLEAENGFVPEQRNRSLVSKVKHVDGIINTTFSEAADEFDIPDSIYHAYLRLMSFDISFQLDIRAGTEFAILFEELYDNKGDLVDYGDIWVATLKLYDNREFTYYRYQDAEGNVDYFARDGKTARKALLKTPIPTRISSTFGARRHPILGYTKQHKGIDFAAPEGTFIYAAGDGKIIARGFNRNGYGRYLIIQHKQRYSTLYAHMYGFGRNRVDGDSRIREGKTIQQGDIIGRVGTTGRSTGPHLHFEIRHNQRHINPLSTNFKPVRNITGAEYNRFLEASLYLEHISKFEDENKAYGFSLVDWLRYRKYIAAIRANHL